MAIPGPDHQLRDLYIHRQEDPDVTGEIHAARVLKAAPALNGVFLEIGNGQQAFLKTRKPETYPEGALLVVELRAAARDDKLPIATTTLSRPVKDKPERPARLHGDPLPWLQPVLAREAGEIITSSPEVAASLRERPDIRNRFTITLDRMMSFDREGIEDGITALMDGLVPVMEGSSLMIEETRACTVIDVDSGNAGAGRSALATAKKVNAAAAREIARHLRLRRIGGLVVIDFLRLPDQAARQAFQKDVSAIFADEPVRTEVIGFTRAGLFELKRPHQARTTSQILGANGRPTLATAARAALRAATRDHRHNPGRAMTLRLPPGVLHWIEGTRIDGSSLATLFARECAGAVTLAADAALFPGQYQIDT